MARSFNSASDYIQLLNESNFDFDFGNSFSVFFWAKTNDITNFHAIVNKFDSGTGVGWRWIAADTTGHYVVSLLTNGTSNGIEKQTIAAVTAGSWYHLGWTYTGSSTAAGLAVYMNGVPAAMTTLQDNAAGSILTDFPVTIAAFTNGGVDPSWDGAIAGLGIWNSALSAANALTLAAGADPLTVANANLIASLPICGDLSPEPDMKGTNNGTVTGTTKVGNTRFAGCQGNAKEWLFTA